MGYPTPAVAGMIPNHNSVTRFAWICRRPSGLPNQCRNASLITPTNSLFLKINSLFDQKNSLLCCLGNLGKKRPYISMLQALHWPFGVEICINSLFFPCITRNSVETGSLQTACTATVKSLFWQCYYDSSMDSNLSRSFRDLGRCRHRVVVW